MKKLLIILLSLIGCTKPRSNVYTVKAGNHYSDNRRLVVIKGSAIRFRFEVNDTWNWKEGQELSKVCGLAWGDPQKNSIRLAVRSTAEGPRLYSFAHVDGKITIQPMLTVQNGWHDCSISYHIDSFIIIVDSVYRITTARTGLKKAVMCWPFCGGSYTLDHDWIVPIEFD